MTVISKVTVTTFSYSSTSIDVGKTSSMPTVNITGTAKSGPTYSSSNTGVATINSSGIVTGVSAGTATITVSYVNYDGSKSTKTCTVKIKATTTTITVNDSGATINGSSPHIEAISLPYRKTDMFGYVFSNGASYYTIGIKFTQNISELYYSQGETMPSTATTKCSSGTGNTIPNHGYNGKVAAFEFGATKIHIKAVFSDGGEVHIEVTRKNTGQGETPISNVKIY